MQFLSVLDSEDLKEAERFFQWAMSYERKGLRIAADAMRDEGRRSYARFLSDKTGQLAGA